MRLWSIHPKYLDSRGLVALWREALLAKKVLEGKTRGYKNHPQLIRFKGYKDPLEAIESYLTYVFAEARERGYKFNITKIEGRTRKNILPVTSGQIQYEFQHLLRKLETRDPQRFLLLSKTVRSAIETSPLFTVIQGDVEPWEKI